MLSSVEVLTIIASVVLALLGTAYTYFSWDFDYWKKRNVPHSPPTIFVGSLTFLMRMSPTEWFIENYNKFRNSDYYGIWLFRKPALVICSPEMAKNILVKDSDNFRDRFLGSGRKDPLGGLNIFTVNDPLWSTIRRRLTPVFTSAKLRSLSGIMNYYAREVTDRIRKEHVVQNKPVDLRDMLTCFSTDVIGATAFGLNENSVRTNDSNLRRITREISTYTLRRGIEFSSIFFYPSLVDFFGFKFFTNEMSAFFRRVFWKIVEERAQDPSNKKKDLLDALIQIRKEAQLEGSEDFTDDVLVAQAAIFVQGGFDTSAVALSYFFLEMSHHPDIQQRLYEELKDTAFLDGNDEYSLVKESPYLSMCIKEVLRKYPAMGFLDRIADKNYKLDDKLTIQAGTPVYVNVVGMHYDEKYFPDPKNYDPERFSEENEKNIVPFSYSPFGDGPRNCIGMRYAQQILRILIMHVMKNFEVRAKPGQPKPNDIKFDRRGVFLGPDIPLDIQFVERNSK